MQQVLSDTRTRQIQWSLASVLTVGIVWYVYHAGITPNVGGLGGIIELVMLNAFGAFIAMSIVGVVMLGLNVLFYYVQTYRHGSYVDHVTDDS